MLWLFSPGDAIWFVFGVVVVRSFLHQGGREPSHHTYVAVFSIERHHHFGVSLEDALVPEVVENLSESDFRCIHIASDEEPALADRSVSSGHGIAL